MIDHIHAHLDALAASHRTKPYGGTAEMPTASLPKDEPVVIDESLCLLPASALVGLLCGGMVSAVQLLELFIARIEREDPGANVVVVRDFARARERYRQTRRLLRGLFGEHCMGERALRQRADRKYSHNSVRNSVHSCAALVDIVDHCGFGVLVASACAAKLWC